MSCILIHFTCILIMMMVCDHEYDDDNDNDIQVSCVFIPRRPLMRYLYELNIVGGEHFLYLCYCVKKRRRFCHLCHFQHIM